MSRAHHILTHGNRLFMLDLGPRELLREAETGLDRQAYDVPESRQVDEIRVFVRGFLRVLSGQNNNGSKL